MSLDLIVLGLWGRRNPVACTLDDVAEITDGEGKGEVEGSEQDGSKDPPAHCTGNKTRSSGTLQ